MSLVNVPATGAARELLERLFSEAEPFGPVLTDWLEPNNKRHLEALKVLYEQNLPIMREASRSPKIIFGRRGSGKTSALMQKVLRAEPTNETYVILRQDHKDWRQAIDFIHNDFDLSNDGKKNLPPSTEEIADIWRAVFRLIIIFEVTRDVFGVRVDTPKFHVDASIDNKDEIENNTKDESSIQKQQDMLQQISNFIKKFDLSEKSRKRVWGIVSIAAGVADSLFKTKFSELSTEAKKVFSQLQKTPEIFWDFVENQIKEDKRKIFLILNFPEEIDVRENREIIAGFLHFIANPELSSGENFELTTSLPTEHIRSLERISKNPLADFSNRLFLHWKADDLVALAVRRLAVFLELWRNRRPLEISSEIIDKISQIHRDPHTAEGFHDNLQCLRAFLGTEPLNRYGLNEEDRLSFIMRHTQMMPRHFLTILNNLADRSEILAGEQFSEDRVRDVVAQTSSLICAEVYVGYRNRWPTAQLICEEILPELSTIFDFQKLKDILLREDIKSRISLRCAQLFEREPEFRRDISHESDPPVVRKMLIEIGAIGHVINREHLFSNRTQYVYADFDYSLPKPLYVHPSDELCVHPVFSLHYSSRSIGEGVSLVIPSGIGLHPLVGRGNDDRSVTAVARR